VGAKPLAEAGAREMAIVHGKMVDYEIVKPVPRARGDSGWCLL